MLLCCARKKLVATNAQEDYQALLREAQVMKLSGTDMWGTGEGFMAFLKSKLAGINAPFKDARWFDQYIILEKNSGEPAIPPKHYDEYKVRYESPQTIWGKDASLFIRGQGDDTAVHFNDVNQGKISNCWLMASMTALARYGKPPNYKKTLIQTLFESEEPDKVSVKLCQRSIKSEEFGLWVPAFTQTISTFIPVYEENKRLKTAYVNSKTAGEYWPCMLEKAIAATITNQNSQTGYLGSESGFGAVGMGMFVPGLPVNFHLPDDQRPKPDELFSTWEQMLSTGVSVLVMWRNMESQALRGLVTNHVYVVLGMKKVGDVALCLMRNPWGTGNCKNGDPSNGEWTGDWSDCSPLWDKHPNIKRAFGFGAEGDDGIFWMHFKDICHHIGEFDIFIPTDPDLRKVDLSIPPFVANGSEFCNRPRDWCNKPEEQFYQGQCAGRLSFACRDPDGNRWVVSPKDGCAIPESISPKEACPEFFNTPLCTNVKCENGGTCNEGRCKCADNFTGHNCSLPPDDCPKMDCKSGMCYLSICQGARDMNGNLAVKTDYPDFI